MATRDHDVLLHRTINLKRIFNKGMKGRRAKSIALEQLGIVVTILRLPGDARKQPGIPRGVRGKELASLEMCESFLTRTIGDYEALPLLRPLWRLYHLTSAFRLASKFLSVR